MDLASLIFATSLYSRSPVTQLARPPADPAPIVVAGDPWDDLSKEQRDRALENYQRYNSLSPEKRQAIDRRYERWQKLPTAEKDRVRRRYDDFRGHGHRGERDD